MIYSDVFPKRHTLLPVVHVYAAEQAAQNTLIAHDHGADGVFLIDHNGDDEQLVSKIYPHAREALAGGARHPNAQQFFIGMNCLDLAANDLASMFAILPQTVNGVWIDHLEGITSGYSRAARIRAAHQQHESNSLLFGGFVFKGRAELSHEALRKFAPVAAQYVDVLTTSGSETGSAPDVEKIKIIREAVGPDMPIAIASGIDERNVHLFAPYVNCFLVATGISKSWTELSGQLIMKMMRTLERL